MHRCSNERPPSISTSLAPTPFPSTMRQTSSSNGPIQVCPPISSPSSLHVRKDLFADGDDFSWNTIQRGRNRFYQRKVARRIGDQVTTIVALLTNALNVHLNLGQHVTINTSSIYFSLETLAFDALANKFLQPDDSVQIRLASSWSPNITNETIVSLRVRILPPPPTVT